MDFKNNNNTMIAESTLNLLRDGITCGNSYKIKKALENSKYINWDNAEVIKMEWDDLMIEANNILKSS